MKHLCIAAAVARRQGRILLARRAPRQSFAGYWEFPGGKLEPGESPEQCLERELLEEFGVAASVGAHLVTSHHQYETFSVEIWAYEVQLASSALGLRVHDAVAWVAPGEFDRYQLLPADVPIAEAISRCG